MAGWLKPAIREHRWRGNLLPGFESQSPACRRLAGSASTRRAARPQRWHQMPRPGKADSAPNAALFTQPFCNKQLTGTTEFPFPIPFPIVSWTQSHSARLPETTTDAWRTGHDTERWRLGALVRSPIVSWPRFRRAGRACHFQPLRGAPGPRGVGRHRRRDGGRLVPRAQGGPCDWPQSCGGAGSNPACAGLKRQWTGTL